MIAVGENGDSAAVVVVVVVADIPPDILADAYIGAYTDLESLAAEVVEEQHYLGCNNNYEDMPD